MTSESDQYLGANQFSIQLNTNFFTSAACQGANCEAWQQFYYSTDPDVIQMQAYLISYSGNCLALGPGWTSDGGGDCYYTTNATPVPQLLLQDLTKIKLNATVVKGGNDTVTYTTPTEAYSNTQPDSITYAAHGWTQTEFNFFGQSGGSIAYFNPGSSITIKIFDGKSTTPTCVNYGTTGELNNLSLGTCTAGPGYIKFTESN